MHLFLTEDINIVCADQRTHDKVKKPPMFFSLRFFQVSVKATHMVIYKKRNLYFFVGFFVCLLLQLCISGVQTEVGWWWGVHLTYRCFVCKEHDRFCRCYKASSQLTRI